MLIPTAPLASARLRILSQWRALVVALVFLALGLVACQGGQATQPPPRQRNHRARGSISLGSSGRAREPDNLRQPGRRLVYHQPRWQRR